MKKEVSHAAFTRRTRGTFFGNETVAASSIVPTLRKPRRMGQPQLDGSEEIKTEGWATRPFLSFRIVHCSRLRESFRSFPIFT